MYWFYNDQQNNFWQEGTVLYEREATPILTAVAYVIDAVLELEDDDLDKICHCNEPQLKTLSKIVSIYGKNSIIV